MLFLCSGQPVARSTPLCPTVTQPTTQLRNGAKPHTHIHCTQAPRTHTPQIHTHSVHTHTAHANGVRNGCVHERPTLGSLPRAASSSSSSSSTGMKNPKKLRSNPSITSQGSKRSKSSSKSTSSQIPTEAQDGETHTQHTPTHAQVMLITVYLLTDNTNVYRLILSVKQFCQFSDNVARFSNFSPFLVTKTKSCI